MFAGLLGVAATSGIAEAQGSSAPGWRAPHGSHASLARAAHVLAGETGALADVLHASAPRSRIARDAMGLALVAERFHRTAESGAPAPVIGRELRVLRREVRQLSAIAGTYPARARLERQLDRVLDAFRTVERIARDERSLHRGRARWGAGPVPARPHLSVRVGL
ncbi:MAG TPA: hypothetical protein VIL20_01245 [Sandaracinaceae bacterium]